MHPAVVHVHTLNTCKVAVLLDSVRMVNMCLCAVCSKLLP